MFRRNTTKRQTGSVEALINPRSHVQKKYFSLMLVPSYSSGKTRSIRIPYGTFYFFITSVLIISAVILFFYLRANHFMKVASEYSTSLDQAQEAYLELQENSLSEQNKLLDNSNELKSQLSEAQFRNQLEKSQQNRTYQEALDALQEQADELERKLRELDEAKQQVLDQLGAKAHIPPVDNLLKDFEQTEYVQISTLNVVPAMSEERITDTRASKEGIEDYFNILAAKIQTQLNTFAALQAQISKMMPYLKNYPTHWPVIGIVSSSFGYRQNPMGGKGGEYHDGIDIRVSTGTSVRATGGGTVVTAGWQGSYGYLVVIDHGFGIQTAYAHNSKILVKAGQKVERGDPIAKSGSTGRSTGPHVHYEVRVNGVATNPLKFIFD